MNPDYSSTATLRQTGGDVVLAGLTASGGCVGAKRLRLTVNEVLRIERVVGGDPVTEALVVKYIAWKWQARSLPFLSHEVGRAMAERPTQFLEVVRKHYAPELTF